MKDRIEKILMVFNAMGYVGMDTTIDELLSLIQQERKEAVREFVDYMKDEDAGNAGQDLKTIKKEKLDV